MENHEVKVIADAMIEKKGQNVVSLDLRKIGTAISDYFIVCNADSTTHSTVSNRCGRMQQGRNMPLNSHFQSNKEKSTDGQQ